jgi:uncharacterized protein (TIGR02466 family)
MQSLIHTIMNYSIVPLFSVPILYQIDSGRRLTASELAILDSLGIRESENKLSDNTHILELPGLENLKDFCQSCIDVYSKDLCKVSDSFYITNSWTTMNTTGVGHRRHTHPNSIISGVFYFDADEKTAPATFHCKSPIFKDHAFDYHYTDHTVFNSSNWSFPVKTGSVIVFPSWVEHGSLPNEVSSSRRLIGFNSFVRGKFGDFNYCSDLELI